MSVRHTARTRARAIELRQAGWSLRHVQRILDQEGHTVPSVSQICRWSNPRREEADRAANRARARKGNLTDPQTFAWPGVRSAEWKIGRIRALHAAGLSLYAIRKVMAVDFPNDPPLTAWAARTALADDQPARTMRVAARTQGVAA